MGAKWMRCRKNEFINRRRIYVTISKCSVAGLGIRFAGWDRPAAFEPMDWPELWPLASGCCIVASDPQSVHSKFEENQGMTSGSRQSDAQAAILSGTESFPSLHSL